MAARRSIFGPQYGSAPIAKSKGRASLPPPDTRPGLPLGLGASPGQAQAPPQASAQPGGKANGAGPDPGDEDMAAMLQRLLAELGDRGGVA